MTFKKYQNKETGDIIEHDGMLFLSQPPKIKFVESGEVKIRSAKIFLKNIAP